MHPANKIRLASYIEGRAAYGLWFDDSVETFNTLMGYCVAKEKIHGPRSQWVEELTPTLQLRAHYVGGARHKGPMTPVGEAMQPAAALRVQRENAAIEQRIVEHMRDDFWTAKEAAELRAPSDDAPATVEAPSNVEAPSSGGGGDFGGGGAGGEF